MAFQAPPYNVTPLRVLTLTLANTPIDQLYGINHDLAQQVEHCSELFRDSKDSASKDGDKAELSVLVHKFKTQISAFVQDKSYEKRLTAILLIQASVNAVGVKFFRNELGLWMRALLSILKVCSPAIHGFSRIHVSNSGREYLMFEIAR